MFQFIRKSDKAKAENKGNKQHGKEGTRLSSDDLHRLDEIRRSFKIGKGRKEKLPSGIIADYSENFLSPLRSPEVASQRNHEKKFTDASVGQIESESSESSLSSLSLKGSPDHETPRERPSASTKKPASNANRYPPKVKSAVGGSVVYSAAINTDHSTRISRPPTSASNSSFTPNYITPPGSPSNSKIQLSKFHPVAELELTKDTLPAVCTKQSVRRTVCISRQSSGDFGFSLRRACITGSDGRQETVLYAEPSQIVSNPWSEVGLLPADRLVSVNSTPVQGRNRDAVISLIKSQQTVSLQIVSDPLFLENISSLHHVKLQDDYQVLVSKPNKIWVVHRNGFIGGHLLEKSDESGKCKVQLENGQLCDISDDDIETTNPSCLDTIAELFNLQLVNESSILHVLRNRYHSFLPFTLVSHESLLYLSRNPQRDSENYMLLRHTQPFTSSKLYPNIYSMVQRSYRNLISTRRSQSILIQGQGSVVAKREILREILNTFCDKKVTKCSEATCNSNKLTATNNHLGTFQERLTAIQKLSEFFCSSDKQIHQKETVLYNLEFDIRGRLIGVNAQVFCLDLERIYEAPYIEILQFLHDLAYCPIDVLNPFPQLKSLRKDLLLEELDKSVRSSLEFFCGEIHKSPSSEMNLIRITAVLESFLLLGQGEAFVKSVWSIFGALYHLGRAIGILFVMLKKNEPLNLKIESVDKHFRRACNVLGIPIENVVKNLGLEDKDGGMLKMLLGFSLGLYFDTINSIFTSINKSNSVGFRNVHLYNINVVNIGFSSTYCGTFGDISSNYVNERIFKFTRLMTMEKLKATCQSEGVTKNHDTLVRSSSISEASSTVTYSGNVLNILPLLDGVKPKGLLLLIDEAKDPATFLEKFESEFYGENEFKNLYSVDYRNTLISLCHGNGTRVVDYDVKKILWHSSLISSSKFTNLLLQESQKDNISCMFMKSSSPVVGLCLSSTASEISLRRASSIRRNCSVTWKKKNASLNVKIQIDYLIDVLERSGVQLVNCLQPSEDTDAVDVDLSSLRNQIRATSVTDILRFLKNNYQVYWYHAEFCRKFRCLGSPGLVSTPRNIVTDILEDKTDCECDAAKGVHETKCPRTVGAEAIYQIEPGIPIVQFHLQGIFSEKGSPENACSRLGHSLHPEKL